MTSNNQMEKTNFSNMDYILFGISLAISVLISIYHGFLKPHGQKRTVNKELFAGGKIGPLPAAMSLVTTFLSAVSLLGKKFCWNIGFLIKIFFLGFPAEIYQFGTMFCYYGLMHLVVFPVAAYIFLPRLYKMNLKSAYQYLEIR